MKTRIIAALTAALTAAAPVSALADDVNVTLDGKKLDFDVPAQIVEDRTVVPMRAIFEALGASVEWDGETRTITSVKDDTEIKMTIGESVIYVNGKPITLDVAPMITEGRTLVPARAVAESFGAAVDWDGETRTVKIKSFVDKVKNAAVQLLKDAIMKAGEYDEAEGTYNIEVSPLILKLSKYFSSADIGYNTKDDSVYIDASGAAGLDLGIDLIFSIASDGTPGVKAEFTEAFTDKRYVLSGVYKDGKLVVTDSTLTDGLYEQAMSCINSAGETIGKFFSFANLGVSTEELGFGF